MLFGSECQPHPYLSESDESTQLAVLGKGFEESKAAFLCFCFVMVVSELNEFGS